MWERHGQACLVWGACGSVDAWLLGRHTGCRGDCMCSLPRDIFITSVDAATTFEELCEEVRDMCGLHQQHPLTLKWVDSEGASGSRWGQLRGPPAGASHRGPPAGASYRGLLLGPATGVPGPQPFPRSCVFPLPETGPSSRATWQLKPQRGGRSLVLAASGSVGVQPCGSALRPARPARPRGQGWALARAHRGCGLGLSREQLGVAEPQQPYSAHLLPRPGLPSSAPQ